MPVSPDPQVTCALRAGLGAFATGVTIITAYDDGMPVGMTVNSFASVSLDPPLVLWSVSRTASCAPAFSTGHAFCVHVLGAGQEALARRFARTGENKFDGLEWLPGQHGAPLLEGCVAEFHCTVSACHAGGDHTIVVGQVDAWRAGEERVLLFHRGQFLSSPASRDA